MCKRIGREGDPALVSPAHASGSTGQRPAQTFNSFGTERIHDHALADYPLFDGINHNLDGRGGHSHSEDIFLRWSDGIVEGERATLHTGPTTSARADDPFAQNVDAETGAISVPDNYTEWPTLGTWTHANTGKIHAEMGLGVHEYHVVHTQVETLRHYPKTGQFPDGAVLVKELLEAATAPMNTGPAVGHATTTKGWFVMVRDTQGRYPDSPLWGSGWGWSLFNADDRQHTVSTNHQADCIGCHLPARPMAPPTAAEDDKWIYVHGYPVLRAD